MCPRSPERFAELREKSKAAILVAATELFAHKGYAGTTTDEIARRAGISKGLVYYHFPSKEAILEALLDTITETTLGLRALREGSVESRGAALIAFIHAWFGEIRTNPALVKLGIRFHSDPEMIRIARKKQESLLKHYIGIFSMLFTALGSRDPEAETFLLGSVLDGIGLNYTAMPDAVPLDRIEALLVHYYSHLRKENS
jgi:AcrR family transcriptional regulator